MLTVRREGKPRSRLVADQDGTDSDRLGGFAVPGILTTF